MGKYNTVLILIGVFLMAILLHMYITRKEFFADAKTPLTKENVQKVLDNTVLAVLSNYQKFKDSKSQDLRIKYRILAMTEMLNALNNQWQGIKYSVQNNINFSKLTMVTLEDLQIVSDFITSSMSEIAPSDVTTPADLTDLNTFTTKTMGFYNFLQQKAPLTGMKLPNQTDTQIQQLLQTMRQQKLNLPNLKPEDVPILKTDLYFFVIGFATSKFALPIDLATQTIPPLVVTNLPSANNTFLSLVSSPSPPSPPSPVSPPVQPLPTLTGNHEASSGLKFSELVQSLLSYSPQQQQMQVVEVLPIQASTASASDLLGAPTDSATHGSNFFDKIRGIVHDEVSGQLGAGSNVKDHQNKAIADRSSDIYTTDAPDKMSSDSLQQGQDYQTDKDCPYAHGQTSGKNVDPYPIDMNDYIRKDRIPCWGCTLK